MRRTRLSIYICSFAALLMIAGCAGEKRALLQGDQADIAFTCRFSNGELAVTTLKHAVLEGERKASIYLPRIAGETVSVIAGSSGDSVADPRKLTFEEEVMNRLAADLVGVMEGEEVPRILTAEQLHGLPENEKFAKVARVRKRSKEQKLSIADYERLTGRKPEVGKRFVVDPLIPGKVVSLTDREALISYSPEKLEGVATPFGPATIRESGDQYEIIINAQPGTMVRSGGLVGRISAVDNDTITLDFSHPFAGETLDCLVKVVGAKGDATLNSEGAK